MPGWHAQLEELREAGEITMVGIIQEQHPDRCALFMQWQEMDFPILIDSLNLLEVSLVPIYVLIDEHGVVREINPRGLDAVKAFVEEEFEAPEDEVAAENLSTRYPWDWPNLPRSERESIGDAEFRRWQSQKDQEFLESAIGAYRMVIEESESGPLHFKLGVACRARYDSDFAQPGDFQKAIDHWLAAGEADPNQYIWRRRVQQFGPRLDKPYSLYDWVEQARADIRARGEEPLPLKVEPRGSELANAAREFETPDENLESPDPDARITRDEGLISIASTIVPHTDAARVRGASARVHLTFSSDADRKAHWNNEGEPMIVWIDQPDGWQVSQRLFTIPNDGAATSTQPRRIEFEIRPVSEDDPGAARRAADNETGQRPVPPITGYALYNVCDGAEGVCLYRRLDFTIE